ncbi:hypothetical protein Pth03_40920 [Planotetraspora thailandica]|uniref:Uncharacterized protein n=1 Tax=Planotetraspora thailandica TaxID=487172 RepID=A0A8J3V2R8_9ACTN|nr:hypothetical protein Pth03_40920 [Planotetraspora thailandica]
MSVHASRGQKIAASVFAIFFLAALTVIAGGGAFVIFGISLFSGGSASDEPDPGFPDDLPPDLIGGDGSDPGSAIGTGAAVFAVLFGLVLLAIALVMLRLLLQTFRHRARLVGTTLEVTGALSTRRADLASARVHIDSVPEYTRDASDRTVPTGRRIPRLIAEDGSGGPVRLRLHGSNRGLLPPDELVALASAVESGPRPEPDASQAAQTAAILRRLATDPIARLL